MKIKITKNTSPKSWYRDRIGEIFNVLEIDEKQKRYIVHKGRICDSFIDFDDCEIFECS